MYTSKMNVPYVHHQVLTPVHHGQTGVLGSELDRLNARYSFVMLNGVHTAYDHKRCKFCDVTSVKNKHKRKIVDRLTGKEYQLTDVWMSDDRHRREFDDVDFVPYATLDHRDPDLFNLWHGWSILPADTTTEQQHADYVAPWLTHIRDVFCSGHEDQYHYFVHWLAHMFQKPQHKPGVAIIIQSGQGFGKGLLTTMLQKIVGHDYTARISDSNQVAGGFSGHMKNKILINLDEATWGGDKKSQGRLKAIITETRLTIEAKHSNAEEVDHYARFLITTNSNYPVPIEVGDRRYFVPDVSNKKPSESHFDTLIDINNNDEALSHLFAYFLNLDISRFSVTRFPHSDKRKLLQQESIAHNDVYTAYIQACHGGEHYATSLVEANIQSSDLYEMFLEWKKRTTFRNVTTTIRSFWYLSS